MTPDQAARFRFWNDPDHQVSHERETMYQAFKERLMRELMVDSPSPQFPGVLIDRKP